MIFLLMLQTFEETRLDVPVVGRPSIGGFTETRVDVPVIGRPSMGASFHRGWSLGIYRARMGLEPGAAPRIPLTRVAFVAAPRSFSHAFLQPGIVMAPPALGGSAAEAAPVAAAAATPGAAPGPAGPVCTTIEIAPGFFVTT